MPVAVSPKPTPESFSIRAIFTTSSTGTTLVSIDASRPASSACAWGPSSTSATSICGWARCALSLATVSVEEPGM